MTKFWKNYRKFKVYTKYSEEEIKHWLLPRKDVIYTYVVENDKKVTDFFSFYSLPSSILKHPVHKTLRVKTIELLIFSVFFKL